MSKLIIHDIKVKREKDYSLTLTIENLSTDEMLKILKLLEIINK